MNDDYWPSPPLTARSALTSPACHARLHREEPKVADRYHAALLFQHVTSPASKLPISRAAALYMGSGVDWMGVVDGSPLLMRAASKQSLW